MKFRLSQSLVKRSLAGHSWIGILVGLPMYLICLSGTIAVFMHEFERWEQPAAVERMDYDMAALDRGYAAVLAATAEPTHHMFVQLPRADNPRLSVSSDHAGWFINADGSLGEQVGHPWTHFLINLHLYLHLPSSFGMIVVSAFGALLCALIVSGFLAHPSIFKDAFNLRLKGARQLGQTDLHNRLSVWGSPFHLVIAVTGAYFGLAGLMVLIFSSAFFDGDRDAVIESVYGAEPELSQPLQTAAVGRALEQMPEIAPEATPLYVTVEEVGEPEQYIIVGATHPDRLIYAEQYRFDVAGNYLDAAGFVDGPGGRQTAFSIYRIHFGHFGGFPVKVLYGIFGLALTIVSVTGINIWLAKRKYRDALNNIWVGLVWGTPVGLALSAIAQVIFGVPATAVFWAALLASTVAAQLMDDERVAAWRLQMAGGVLLLLLVAGHAALFGAAAASPAALGVNLVVALSGLVLIWMGSRARQSLLGRASFPREIDVAP